MTSKSNDGGRSPEVGSRYVSRADDEEAIIVVEEIPSSQPTSIEAAAVDQEDDSFLTKDMAAVRAMLRRLSKFHAPEHFYGQNHMSPLAQKYPFITREAAVLIPLLRNPADGQLQVLLTQRSQLVRSHKGEVAFPGGVRDRTDHGPIETALRESYEEVGLPYEYTRVGACLIPLLTRHDFLIFPVIGFITEPKFQPVCNEEVAKCFAVPLKRFLSDRGHYVRKFRAEQSGREFLSHFFEDRVNGDVQVTFGITAIICMWAAMLVYERKPSFPIYMFESEEMSLPYNRLVGEWERLQNSYLTRRMEQIQTVSRL